MSIFGFVSVSSTKKTFIDMFKKSRNIRARKLDSESDGDDLSQNESVSPGKATASSDAPTKQTVSKQESTKPQKCPISNSKLSFDIEEGEEFQLKKSNHSKKLMKQYKKEKAKEDAKSQKFCSSNEKSLRAPPPIDLKLGGDEEEEEDDGRHIKTKRNDSSSRNNMPSMQDILKSGEIPDANMIHLARKKRQMARECGEDFIPLDDTQRFDRINSRLIRDDDNDASDSGDESNVLALTSKQKDAQRRWIEEKILAAEEDSVSDNEEDAWEEQQIKKGTSIPAQPVVVTAANDLYPGSYHQHFMFNSNGGMSVMNYTIQNNMTALEVNEMNAINERKLSAPKKTIEERLQELKERHKQRNFDFENLSARSKEVVSSIDFLKNEISVLKEEYKFYQDMREFTKDYVECMNEKVSSINYLERCMTDLLKQRTDKLINRRQEDVRDQSLEFFPGKIVTDAVTEDLAKARRKAEREGRRARRKRARESKGIKNHSDGMSTDDELINSEIVKFGTEKERLTKDCKSALDDVDEEFCSIPSILARFERWKKEKMDSYVEAYVGHCLTKLFSPLIKLQLITWNPLETYCPNFEKSQWFQDLLFYGSLDFSDSEVADPDMKILPNIIDKVLVPKITVFVENVWDPLSLKQSCSLKKVVQQLADDYPFFVVEEKNAQILIKAVDARISKCLKDDIFMPLYGKNVLENRNSGATLFFYRQLYTCIKLFKSIVLWQGIMSNHQLQSLALDQLLNRYIMIALQNAPFNTELLTVCQTISSDIPKQWFEEYLQGISLPQLENLCKFLVSSATTLKNQVPSNSDTRDTIKRIGKVLLELNAESHASSVGALIGSKMSLH